MAVEQPPEQRSHIPADDQSDIVEFVENGRTIRVPAHILADCVEVGKPVGCIASYLKNGDIKGAEDFLSLKRGEKGLSIRNK